MWSDLFEEGRRRQSAIPIILLIEPFSVLFLHHSLHSQVPLFLLPLVLRSQHQGLILGIQRHRVAFPAAATPAHAETAPQVNHPGEKGRCNFRDC